MCTPQKYRYEQQRPTPTESTAQKRVQAVAQASATAHSGTPTASAAYLAAIAAPKDFRDKIEASIGNVAALYGMSHTQAYTYIGSLMLSIWGIDLTEYDRPYGESILTVLVRYRLDARFYSLIQSELNSPSDL